MIKTGVSRAGHGGTSPGAVYKNVREADLNLAVDHAFAAALHRKYTGYKLVRVRTADTNVSLAQNGIIVNRENAQAYGEWHFNAGGGTGPETYIHTTNATDEDKRLARIVQGKIMERVKDFGVTRDRGIKAANFQSLRETGGVPSILVEILFMDNETDRAAYTSPGFFDAIGEALADGFAEFLELPAKEDEELIRLREENAMLHNQLKIALANYNHAVSERNDYRDRLQQIERLAIVKPE